MGKFTAEDVIEYLEEIGRIASGEYYGRYQEEMCKAYHEVIDEAIKAVKKNHPQKVTHEATLQRYCTCPYCNGVVDEFTEFFGRRVRVQFKYCHFCGQALDWSGE